MGANPRAIRVRRAFARPRVRISKARPRKFETKVIMDRKIMSVDADATLPRMMADLGFEFTHAKLFVRYGILLEGLPSVVGGRVDAGLAARLVDVQSSVEVGPDVPEDRGDPVGAGPLSHAIAPWSLPVVRFAL